MKVRLRFRKITKVITINDDQEDIYTLQDIRQSVVNLFADSIHEDFKLSLNKTDTLDDETKTLVDCGIVSGDLIYIITSDCDTSTSTSSSASDVVHTQELPGPSEIAEGSVSMDMEATCPSGREQIQPRVSGTSTDTVAVIDDIQGEQQAVAVGADPLDCEPGEPVDMVLVNQYLNEPTLCREASEGRVPAMLREVYAAVGPEGTVEAVCVVIHVLMLETGYIIHPEPTAGTLLAEAYNHPGFYRFVYTYPGCQDTTCSITIVTLGRSLMVHGKVHGDASDTRQCTIKAEMFVRAVSQDCCQTYCCLAKLSRMFKDAIAHPLVHDVRQAAGIEDIFGLLSLTQEIKLQILSCLRVRHLLRISLVNSEFSSLCKDPYIWRRLHLKDFGNRRDNSLSQDWRKLYIQEYKMRKERRKLMSRMTMVTPPTFGPPIFPFSGPSQWIPPGPSMIGGDYDLFPTGLPGAAGRFGQQSTNLPRPRYDLIGPHPDLDPSPDSALLPRIPVTHRRGGGQNPFKSFGPRFF